MSRPLFLGQQTPPNAPTGIQQTPGSITVLSNTAPGTVLAALSEIGGTGISVVYTVIGNSNLDISGSNLVVAAGGVFSPGVNQPYSLSVNDTGGTFTDPPSDRTITVTTAPSAISFTGTSVVDNVAAGAVIGTLSTTNGASPYTYTCSNSKFTISGSNVLRSGTGTLTAGVSESLNFTTTDAASNSYTTVGHQGPFTLTVTAHGALSLPATLYNLDPSVSYTTPFVTYSQAFGDGDIPSGGSVTATDSLSNPVTVQMDALALWPSGCVRWAVLSHACAETFAGGSNKIYTLGSSGSAPNNTPAAGWGGNAATTMAANSDFKAVYSGFDAGASTYTVSLNSIMSTYTRATAQNWGTSYPTGGWEYTKIGPVCVEFHGWQYIKNDSTGNTQGYVRCDMWVKAWSPTGPYEIDVLTSEPNIWNTVPLSSGAEQFNQKMGRWITSMVVKNGASTVFSTGTVNDPGATVVANVNFNTTTNRIGLSSFYPQCSIAFSTPGTLPAGLAANTLYFPAVYNGTTGQPYLCIDRATQSWAELNSGNWSANSSVSVGLYRLNGNIIYRCVVAGTTAASGGPTGTGTNIVDGTAQWQNATVPFISQGSGAITAYPVNSAFQTAGWCTGDLLGNPIWVGSGTRPNISVGHDFTYLTTKSKFTPPYNLAAGFQTTNQALQTYYPNSQFGGIQWSIAASGDGAGDQRIGYISGFAVASLFNPSDPYYATATIQAGLSWLNFCQNFMNDDSSGNPFVGNNGTNNSGTPYPNLPSLIPAWCGSNIAGNVSAGITARGAAWSGWSTAFGDQGGGVSGQYYPTTSGAHMPATWQIAYLRSGRPVFLDMGIQMANTQCFMGYQGKQVLGPDTYYCLINGNYGSCQLRAWGWSLRSLCQALYMIPNNHIFYLVLRDYYNDNAKFQADLTATFSAAQATFGILRALDHGGTGNAAQGHLAPWMGYFVYIAVIMEVWRGGLTGATAGTNYDTLLDYMANQWKLYIPAVDANALNYISAYDLIYSPITGQSGGYTSCYTSAAALFAASFNQGCQFTGSCSGTTLTVTAVASGSLVNNQAVYKVGGSSIAYGNSNNVSPTNITAQLTGTPGGIGTYTVNRAATVVSQTLYQQAANGVVPGPPFLTYLYDQNGAGNQSVANYPENCNYYGSMARAVLTMHKMVRPSDTNVSTILANLLTAQSAGTGISSTTAGIQWYGPKTGIIQNFQTFAIF